MDGIVPWMPLLVRMKWVSLPEVHVRPTQVLAQGPGPEKFHVFDGSHVAEFVLVLKSWSAFSSAGDMAITEVIRQSKNQCRVVGIMNEIKSRMSMLCLVLYPQT